jgi:Prophage antirepressor
MNNQLRIFENEDFGKIRVIDIDGEPWFVGADVTKRLGYRNPRDAISKHVDDEDKGVAICDTLGGNQNLTIINESGLYSLIILSKLPAAKAFKRWITTDVLPSLRKHGIYIANAALEEMTRNRDAAENLLAMFVERLQIAAPKAKYYELVLQAADAVQISIIAKDYGMSAVSFNKLLHGLRVQFKVGGTWVLYKNYADKGYTVTRTYHVNETTTAIHTYWTQRGRFFLYDFLKYHGIIPEAEKAQNIMIGGSAHINE